MKFIKENPLWSYIGLVFILSTIPYIGAVFAGDSDSLWTTVLMFIPAIAAIIMRLLTKEKIKLGWKPKSTLLILSAFFVPFIIKIFAVFISVKLGFADYNSNFVYLKDGLMGARGVGLLFGASPMNPALFSLNFIASIFVASLFYIPLAMGEELGWRGYMQHLTTKKYGLLQGLVLLGIIWGYWHAPLILIGHNFPRFPIFGALVLMPIFTTAFSIVWGYAYIKSKSIWVPVLFHATFNIVATIAEKSLQGGHHKIGYLAVELSLWILAAIIFLLFYKKRIEEDTEIIFK